MDSSNAEKTAHPRRSAIHRFVHRFTIGPNGCWLWKGSVDSAGYPQMSIDSKNTKMHRWSQEHFNGPVPEGMQVCHRCDVKQCVNPTHLEVGTPSKNTQDAFDRGLYVPHNASRTHCKRGHELRPAVGGRQRRCLVCLHAWHKTDEAKAKRNEIQRIWRAKRRAATIRKGDTNA